MPDKIASHPGNAACYAVQQTPVDPQSPLQGMQLLWLGSSVTYGYGSLGESMADFLDRIHGTVSRKEAISGTTLADVPRLGRGGSYILRLEAALADPTLSQPDCMICQLSTNDMHDASTLGQLTPADVTDPDAFDRRTTYGAMERIIALVQARFHCPILFYTGSWFEHPVYAQMVAVLRQMAEKWQIGVIDLYGDEAFNAISREDYDRYMLDSVHPTRAGYRDWWLPAFVGALTEVRGR